MSFCLFFHTFAHHTGESVSGSIPASECKFLELRDSPVLLMLTTIDPIFLDLRVLSTQQAFMHLLDFAIKILQND